MKSRRLALLAACALLLATGARMLRRMQCRDDHPARCSCCWASPPTARPPAAAAAHHLVPRTRPPARARPLCLTLPSPSQIFCSLGFLLAGAHAKCKADNPVSRPLLPDGAAAHGAGAAPPRAVRRTRASPPPAAPAAHPCPAPAAPSLTSTGRGPGDRLHQVRQGRLQVRGVRRPLRPGLRRHLHPLVGAAGVGMGTGLAGRGACACGAARRLPPAHALRGTRRPGCPPPSPPLPRCRAVPCCPAARWAATTATSA